MQAHSAQSRFTQSGFTRSMGSASGRLRHPMFIALLLMVLRANRRQPSLAAQSVHSRPAEQGLTIIECLVAIVVIALTVVAITPPIMLATASRIQSRKIEKANQIAQGEIDRVRLMVERGTYAISDLPGDSGSNTISSVGPATGSPTSGLMYSPASCNTYPSTTPVAVSNLIQVDVDGDCVADYVMQVFRTTGYTPTNAAAPYSFVMGVRVYAYYPNQTFLPLDTTKASARMGTGSLDLAGGKRLPMAVLYSNMARNDSSQSLGRLCVQTGGSCTY